MGRGGTINPDDIFLLRNAVEKVHTDIISSSCQNKNSTTTTTTTTTVVASSSSLPPPPRVSFVSDTNETFWTRREPDIMKYRNTKNDDGNYTYFPYGEQQTYEYPGTLDNIVKQWHSVNAVWDAMEKEKSNNNNENENENDDDHKKRKYRRVAITRNDVIYLTPIEIYEVQVQLQVQVQQPPSTSLNAQHRQHVINDYTRTNNTISGIPNFAK